MSQPPYPYQATSGPSISHQANYRPPPLQSGMLREPPLHQQMAVPLQALPVPPPPLNQLPQVPSIEQATDLVERDLIKFYGRLTVEEFNRDIRSSDVSFLKNVPEAYRMDRLSHITFDHPGMRCAYIFLNTPCFSNVVAYHFRGLLDINPFILQRALCHKSLSVCCLQGGPAPELLAIVKVVEMFLKFQPLRPETPPKRVVIKATVVDIDGGWRETAKWIEQNWNNLFDTSLVQLQLSFVQADLTKPMCSEVREAVRSADVVTMAVFGTYNRVNIPFQGAIFKEDKVPDDKIHIGDSVFVYPSTFRGDVSVHVRRFKKYGDTFYPTKEGITLRHYWIQFIMNRESVPTNANQLKGSIFLPAEEIKIHSSDFHNFTFTRFVNKRDGEVEQKSIILSSIQWTEMMKRYDDITTAVLDHIYGSMDFFSAYKVWEEGIIEESLPESLDVSLGTQCLVELLRDSLSECIKSQGGLKDPGTFAGELWSNRVGTFNDAASAVKIEDIANSFYCKLWSQKDFLILAKPALYVTKKFLTETRLQDVLREVRNMLCVPNAFEYFEDVSGSMFSTQYV